MDLRKLSQLLYKIKIISQEGSALFEKETGFSLTRYEMLMFLWEKGKCLQNWNKASYGICFFYRKLEPYKRRGRSINDVTTKLFR